MKRELYVGYVLLTSYVIAPCCMKSFILDRCTRISQYISNRTMWLFFIVTTLSSLLIFYLCRRQFSPMAVGKAATFAQIDTLTLLLFYIPIFFLQGLVPAILAARQYYGPSFYLKIWGIKRRIFFITDPEGRKTVSKSAFIRMPDGLVAQVFGVSHKTVGKRRNKLLTHRKISIILINIFST